MENASILEVGDLHVSVQSTLDLEGDILAGPDSDLLVDLQVSSLQLNREGLVASKA